MLGPSTGLLEKVSKEVHAQRNTAGYCLTVDLLSTGNMTLKSLNLPEHVRAIKWAPQNDVLAHAGTKVFVTHGGSNSVYEGCLQRHPDCGAAHFCRATAQCCQGAPLTGQ